MATKYYTNLKRLLGFFKKDEMLDLSLPSENGRKMFSRLKAKMITWV